MTSLLFHCLVVLLLFLCSVVSAAEVHPSTSPLFIRVDPSTGHFIDASNNTRIFHGVNVVVKTDPYYPNLVSFDTFSSLTDEDGAYLSSLGMNLIRLGNMWPAVEPTNGNYNYTYLNILNDLVYSFGEKYGIYFLIDLHQDLLHPSLCGEGLPTHVLNVTDTSCDSGWAKWFKYIGVCKSIKDYNMAVDPKTGYPLTSECLKHQFSFFYITPDVSSAFQSLYTNDYSIEKIMGYWNVTASVFKDNPYVLGYDLLNEPWIGMVWNKPALLIPGETDHIYLQPLYQKLHQTIRAVDDQHIITYEPTPLPDTIPIGIAAPVGFTASPGGAEYNHLQALNYHIYCCAASATACLPDGNPSPNATAFCDRFNPSLATQREKDSKRLGGGIILSEFGACTTGIDCVHEIQRTTQAADTFLHSWAYWQYKYYNDITTQSGPSEGFWDGSGTLLVDKVKALSRTYAPVVQGVATAMSFDSDTAAFQLSYNTDRTYENNANTLIFLHSEYYYPNGFNVALSSTPIALPLTWKIVDKHYISVQIPFDLYPDTLTISVQITPK